MKRRILATGVWGLVLTTMGGVDRWDWEEMIAGETRIRYEMAEQDGLGRSEAVTARFRYGVGTESWKGWRGYIEGEFTLAANGEAYDAYPGAQGEPGKTVIADPKNAELNRAQLEYSGEGIQLVLGRQRIIRHNARFIGNVGWRQNEQTYDGVLLKHVLAGGPELVYGYLGRANRIFGTRAEAEVQRYFEMETHLVEGNFSVGPNIEAGIYGYLVRIENSRADSSDTFGIWANGSRAIAEDLSLRWRAEYAWQTENDVTVPAPGFDLGYAYLAAGLKGEGVAMDVIMEWLEGNGQRGFSTPLATLHAFNGFADVFLSTPGEGLRDIQAKLSGPLGRGLTGALVYHWFTSDGGSVRYGNEIDGVLSWKYSDQVSITAKAAVFDGDQLGDVEKIWLQTDFTF